jgi:hypothetical protein
MFLLPVKTTPHWGLNATQMYRIGDPLGRPLRTIVENGESLKVTEWYPGTPIAKVYEWIDRHGHAKERVLQRLNAGSEEGVPYDLTAHYKLNHWGQAALSEERALVRGTSFRF